MLECEREAEGGMGEPLGGSGNNLKRKRLTSVTGITDELQSGVADYQPGIEQQPLIAVCCLISAQRPAEK